MRSHLVRTADSSAQTSSGHRSTWRLLGLLALLSGCYNAELWTQEQVRPASDAAITLRDGGVADHDAWLPRPDAGPPAMDAGRPDAGPRDAGPPPIIDAGPPPDAGPIEGLAPNLRVDRIALYQNTEIVLVEGGSAAARGRAPIVAQKPAMVRAFVSPMAGWSPQEVRGVLTLRDGDDWHDFVSARTITGTSNEGDAGSFFEWDVPAEALTIGTDYAVSLSVPDGMDPSTAGSMASRFPAGGDFSGLGAEGNGGLDIVVVPIRYQGRLPDTGPGVIAALEEHALALFPTGDVRITVREPYDWGRGINRSGGGWTDLLNGMLSLRDSERPGNEVYYLGVFNPGGNFESYCSFGCVTGLAPLNDMNVEGFRVGIALGFTGEVHRFTQLHELAHAHGRAHAPCGNPRGIDSSYPYGGARIGVRGYDARSGTIHASSTTDVLGYCTPQWISDYTSRALFDRMASVSGPGAAFDSRIRLPHYAVGIEAFRSPSWAETTIQMPLADEGDEHTIVFTTLDINGHPMGNVAVREVLLSNDARTYMLPVLDGVVAYQDPEGHTLNVPDRLL